MKIKRYAIYGLVVFAILFLAVKNVLALDLTLTKIGTLSTIGVDYTVTNISGEIPTLEGTASPSAQVLIKIKISTDATMAASPSGVWTYKPGVLDPGSNTIVITSGTQSLSFVLNYNATPSATPTATPTEVPSELPATGVWEYYLLAIGFGVAVLFLGKYVKDRMSAWEGKKK
jgi:hypothetical protein